MWGVKKRKSYSRSSGKQEVKELPKKECVSMVWEQGMSPVQSGPAL